MWKFLNSIFCRNSGKNRLYIIGNGFDRFHDIPSSYWDFKKYVQEENPELFEALGEYFYDDELWSDFEETLAYIDTEKIIDDATNYLESYGTEDWSDAYHHDYQYEIDRAIGVVTEELRKCFLSWIRQLEIPTEPRIHITKASRFLTFNYTPTLEQAYGVRSTNILYVHGKAVDENSLLILGHSRTPSEESSFSKDNDEDTDVRVAEGNQILDQYFEDTYKNTEQIVSENSRYFSSLRNVKEIYVLGHSLSIVDMRYFQVIAESIRKDAKWVISFHSDDEKEKRKNIVINLGINPANIELVSFNSLRSDK
jgi:hypothetical protein